MFKKLFHIVRVIWQHELAKKNRTAAFVRFLILQVSSRLSGGKILVPLIGDVRLFCQTGMTAANGNYYLGLMEFRDMSFLLHYLRRDDLFVDCGANIGSYTLLASGGVGARTVAFEPVPETGQHFLDNVAVNRLQGLVELRPVCISDHTGSTTFTVEWDTTNRIASGQNLGRIIEVPMSTLDEQLETIPRLIKIDTEGTDAKVLLGSHHLLEGRRPMALIVEMAEQPDDSEIISYLEAKGFLRVEYDPFNRTIALHSPHGKSLAANNQIFVRDLADATARVQSAPAFELPNGVSI